MSIRLSIRHSHLAVLTLSAVLGTALLTACGSDGGPSADPSEPTTSSTSETPGDEPTEEPSATVEPATGKRLEGDQFTVNIPQGWRADPEVMGVTFTYDPHGTDTVVTGVSAVSRLSLDQAAKRFSSSVSRDGVRRLPDTTLGGEPAFHLTAEPVGEKVYEAFGLWRNNEIVTLEFDITGTKAERQQLMESVAATWQWK